MRLTSVDYFLARLANAAPAIQRILGNAETEHYRRELGAIAIERPVFLTGLARSGTTILLQELVETGAFATHRYRDFPFLMTPCFWNHLLERFARQQAPVERPHQDRIRITAESPEAFEEPIWQYFFPHVHARDAIHRIDSNADNPRFEQFFRAHIQKILFLRGGSQYLSKGNYNLSRLEYLARLFPDGRFIIPVRHPLTHVPSLIRQHQLFSEYSRSDRRIPRYLAMAGHYEFGPQRIPLRLTSDDADAIDEAWQRGDDYTGYAIQWAHVYHFINALRRQGGSLAEQILLVRYEDLCADPRDTLNAILEHSLDAQASVLGDRTFSHISLSSRTELSDELADSIWSVTEDVASLFGYEASVPTSGQENPTSPGPSVQVTPAGLTC